MDIRKKLRDKIKRTIGNSKRFMHFLESTYFKRNRINKIALKKTITENINNLRVTL